MTDRCRWCGRFKAKFCLNCEGTQRTLEGNPISDTHSQVSVVDDRVGTYRCHRCIKRKRCKLRTPDKLKDAWKMREDCDKYEEDEEWWQ
jgi:hypothetical protein